MACDFRSDKKYILVGLDTDQNGKADRFATTQGNNAPYCSDWKSGDLKENERYSVWIWSMGSDGLNYGTIVYSVNS